MSAVLVKFSKRVVITASGCRTNNRKRAGEGSDCKKESVKPLVGARARDSLVRNAGSIRTERIVYFSRTDIRLDSLAFHVFTYIVHAYIHTHSRIYACVYVHVYVYIYM